MIMPLATLMTLEVLRRNSEKLGMPIELYAAEVLANLNWAETKLIPVQLELPLGAALGTVPRELG